MATMHYFPSYSLSSAQLVSSSPHHTIRQDGTINKLNNYSGSHFPFKLPVSLINHFFKIKQLCCLLSTNIDIFLSSSPTTVSAMVLESAMLNRPVAIRRKSLHNSILCSFWWPCDELLSPGEDNTRKNCKGRVLFSFFFLYLLV